MPASEARILANQRNAQHSTGPRTVEGKERSRRNALKHGMTGAGIVLAEADAIEVERRVVAFEDELEPSGEVGLALVRRAALNSVRMERGADQQTAALTEHVRQVEADFVAPEGVDAETAARLRSEASRRAMFDPSQEACLARKYELAAERGFYRAIKELRLVERACNPVVPGDDIGPDRDLMGSFSEDEMTDEEFDALSAKLNLPTPSWLAQSPPIASPRGGIDLPISAGRPR